jgi:hypothetical protein
MAGLTVSDDLRASVTLAFLEGCVGESVAAVQAGVAAELSSDPEARQLLRRIAADEARHAELAWSYVAWASRTDPTATREGIAAALARSREESLLETAPPLLPATARATWNGAGRLTPRQQHVVRAEALRTVVRGGLPPLGIDATTAAV